MFSGKLTRFIAIGATGIAIAGGAYGIVTATRQQRLGHRDNRHLPRGNIGATRARRRGIQRSVWTGRRGSSRHGRQRVQVELHTLDSGGSEGDGQQGVLNDECH